MTALFNALLCSYVAALLIAMISVFAQRRVIEWITNGLLTLTGLAHTAYIILRWVAAGRPPFSNMFESLVLFSWAIVVVYLFIRIRYRLPVLGAASALLAAATLAYGSAFGSDIHPLVPALQSNWLTFHVFTCFLGYAGFAISAVAAIAYLILSAGDASRKAETIELFDIIMNRTVGFGFIFLTLGIISGSVWANSAWGTYWSWDPKETWSLITWLIYAAFLHCKYIREWNGKRMAWLSIIGFLSVLVTYLGVNLVGKLFGGGLHSYGSE